MSNNYFDFGQFSIKQGNAAFKVGTDSVLLGASADLSGAVSILDIGTGTGLIALICAQRSGASVTAIEPDRNSYLEAVGNILSSKWADRITVINSDLNEFTGVWGKMFDLIITNPPYFRDSLLNPDEAKAAARHTFSLSSLDLLKCSEDLMNDRGSLQLILPYEEAALFIAEAGNFGLYCNSIIKIKPYPDGKIIRMIMKLERKKKAVHEKFLTIETGTRHSYTDEYRELTKDFYRNF